MMTMIISWNVNNVIIYVLLVLIVIQIARPVLLVVIENLLQTVHAKMDIMKILIKFVKNVIIIVPNVLVQQVIVLNVKVLIDLLYFLHVNVIPDILMMDLILIVFNVYIPVKTVQI